MNGMRPLFGATVASGMGAVAERTAAPVLSLPPDATTPFRAGTSSTLSSTMAFVSCTPAEGRTDWIRATVPASIDGGCHHILARCGEVHGFRAVVRTGDPKRGEAVVAIGGCDSNHIWLVDARRVQRPHIVVGSAASAAVVICRCIQNNSENATVALFGVLIAVVRITRG